MARARSSYNCVTFAGSTTHHDDDRLRGKVSLQYEIVPGARVRCEATSAVAQAEGKAKAGENHKDDAHGLETKALANRRD
jgi:hypothetical protein